VALVASYIPAHRANQSRSHGGLKIRVGDEQRADAGARVRSRGAAKIEVGLRRKGHRIAALTCCASQRCSRRT
jgi:hypothetical protein